MTPDPFPYAAGSVPAEAPADTARTENPLVPSLETLSRDEKSLLLYFESRCVDSRGTVSTPQMNADDFEIAERWTEIGFIEFGRLSYESVTAIQGIINKSGTTHYVQLSPEAWELAHAVRRARAERDYANRKWRTAEEARGIGSVSSFRDQTIDTE